MADNLLLPISLERILDSDGNPVPGGKVNVYDAGTTDFKNVFTNNTLVTAATNPIIADSGGYVEPRFIGTGDYKLVITDSADVTIKTADNLTGALDTSSFANDEATPVTPAVTKSSNYTVQTTDKGDVILADATGGSFTVTLLSAATATDGFRVTIKHVGSANAVTVATSGGDTLDGESSFLLDAQYESITCLSDGANWHITDEGRIVAPTTPPGVIWPYGGATAPAGFVLCDGSAISRTTFADLFAIISTTFGAGDGSTTFNVPDMGGRAPAGKESTATRLTSAGSGVDGATLGAVGGDQNKTVAQANLPSVNLSHSLAVSTSIANGAGVMNAVSLVSGAGGGAMVGGNSGGTTLNTLTLASGAVSGTVSLGGSGTALAVAQPTIILNYIIKT